MLEDVIDVVNTRLALAGVRGANGLALVAAFGAELLAHEDAPPRIIIVPTDDRFGPPFQINENPRSIGTCMMGAEVHFWGVTRKQCRAISREFIKQLFGAVGNDYELGRGRFDPRPANVRFGFEYILDIQVNEPITLSTFDPAYGVPSDTFTTTPAIVKRPITGTLTHP